MKYQSLNQYTNQSTNQRMAELNINLLPPAVDRQNKQAALAKRLADKANLENAERFRRAFEVRSALRLLLLCIVFGEYLRSGRFSGRVRLPFFLRPKGRAGIR